MSKTGKTGIWALAMLVCAAAQAAPACSTALDRFREFLGSEDYPLRWEEIGMGDGKPLTIAISAEGSSLFFEFHKAKEGLWASGNGMVCREGNSLLLRFAPGQLVAGPAANWAMRVGLHGANEFKLKPSGVAKLRISGVGWDGIFVPANR